VFLPGFRAARGAPPPPAKTSAVETALAAMSPDELTPRSALEALYRLKALLKN
jgi:DNA mismatch repair protein MutS